MKPKNALITTIAHDRVRTIERQPALFEELKIVGCAGNMCETNDSVGVGIDDKLGFHGMALLFAAIKELLFFLRSLNRRFSGVDDEMTWGLVTKDFFTW